jgi:hypothetical protein
MQSGTNARFASVNFAADAQWPHINPGNAEIRAEFKLPPNRGIK